MLYNSYIHDTIMKMYYVVYVMYKVVVTKFGTTFCAHMQHDMSNIIILYTHINEPLIYPRVCVYTHDCVCVCMCVCMCMYTGVCQCVNMLFHIKECIMHVLFLL